MFNKKGKIIITVIISLFAAQMFGSARFAHAATLSIAITNPSYNSTISGTVSITATVQQGGASISNVQFLLDGSSLGNPVTVAGQNGSYSYAWATTGSANGQHVISAVVTDSSQNTATSNGVLVNVQNTSGTSLSVNITSPTSGSTEYGTVILTATTPRYSPQA